MRFLLFSLCLTSCIPLAYAGTSTYTCPTIAGFQPDAQGYYEATDAMINSTKAICPRQKNEVCQTFSYDYSSKIKPTAHTTTSFVPTELACDYNNNYTVRIKLPQGSNWKNCKLGGDDGYTLNCHLPD